MNKKFSNKNKVILFFGVLVAVVCAGLFFPNVQNKIISISEMLLQRTLRDHAKWKTLLTQFACSAIFVEVFVLLLYLDPKNLFTEIIPKNKKYILNFFFVAIPVFVFLYIVLPFVLFGENSVITVWDWLDSFSGAWKYIRANNLLFKLNAQTTQLDNLHSVYFAGGGGAMNFTLLAFIYNCFSEIPAYAMTRALATILGFVSMYKLLELTFSSSLNNEAGLTRDTILFTKNLMMLVALIYAVLPVTPHYAFSVASLPLAILLFYHIATNQILRKKYFLFAFLYPVVCEFSSTGIFICGFWFISFIILSIHRQKIQWNLLAVLIVMSAGFVLVNFRLFYMRLIENEPLNRDFFKIFANPIDSFKMYFLHGQEHASSLHNKYILPITPCVFLFSICTTLYKHRNKNISIMFANSFKNLSTVAKTLVISFAFIFIFSVIAAIDGAGIFRKLFSVICPPLNGFSFARLHIFSRFLWYIAFCASLIFLWENSNFTKFVSVILVILQIHIVLTATVPFADSYASWKRNLEHGGKEKYITFKEFFSESQFDEIKKYINYDGENVAAYGYHPSVLMYNGFNCIDGYVSTYPYKDMLKFRTLIAPALEVDEETKTYYDSWGGRRYLYPSPRGLAAPTREKHKEPIPLYINPEVFRNGYNGKYILSSYPISNANELGFELVKSFDSDDSIYIIYVYEID